ncbi:substrate-binding domain-containing protein [Paenibacillus sp. TRM 82003]|nr:substrate-binding domain-containing protein [Paenibacillus sp. TRM 82003]
MLRRPSIQSIADMLGLSKYAVSRALSGKTGVSEDTRRRVLAAARAVGYRLPSQSPPGETAASASGPPGLEPANRYVLVWADPSIPQEPSFWSRVLAGVATACAERGWAHAVVTPGAGGDVRFPAYMDQTSCLGHIAVGNLPGATLLSLRSLAGPLVLIDNEEPVVGADAVGNGNADGARLLVQHLHRQGRRSFLFIGCDAFAHSFRDRWVGCRLAVEALGEGVRLRRWTLPYPERRWADPLALKLNALAPEDRPDAFVCANDDIALELLRRLKALGLQSPEDVAVAGFDNIRDAASAEPPLTTVELAKEALGSRAVEQLARRLAQPGTLPETVALSPRLVVRSSG